MTRPGFFIVGAPKCGTTALYTYLAEHPAVFMPELKEPHFFSSDLREYFNVTELGDYLQLFAPAKARHRAVGEASVWYLYSTEAVRRIRRFDPDARLIVMVRQPVSMYLSLHNQMIATAREDFHDAERAWRLQADRAQGQSLPRHCEQPKLLQYGSICRLGEQLERVLDEFPRQQVLAIVFDDFIRDPGGEYRRALEFLALEDDEREHFPPVNVAHRMRWPTIGLWHRLADRTLRIDRRWRLVRRMAWPLRAGTRALRRVNLAPATKSKISRAFERELLHEFGPDIDKLAGILGRDLSRWKEAPADD